ncbi:MAG: hypothetical protein GF307_08515 [candidate division Zixibacteria bacterium]|nr:hypothetical protein [candidate division Zixibacteria bacterium]
MQDKSKIVIGLLIFLVIITFPIWYNLAGGKATYRPDLKYVTDAKECVAPTDYMTSNHMDLLNEWRDEVVRDKDRVYMSFNGNKYDKSLTNTCLDCHSNKADFCDKCHDYMSVDPYCWDCHIIPEEVH